MSKHLQKIFARLTHLKKKYKKHNVSCYIPSKWLEYKASEGEVARINPFDFFHGKIDEIINYTDAQKNSTQALTFALEINSCLYFEHKPQSNIKKFPKNYFPDNGTFLKAIAFLPYLKYHGFEAIELQDISSSANDWEVKSHNEIGDNLAEYALEMSKEEQFSAFLEACRILKIKVSLAFDFARISANSNLALNNPEFFFWIKSTAKMRSVKYPNGYGKVKYSANKIRKINKKIILGDYNNLPEPDEKYRSFFTSTPLKVALVEGKIIGLLKNTTKPLKTNECVIAPGFQTYPLEQNDEEAYSETSYFKFYNHHDFNYIAYNTIAHPDHWLAASKNINKELWQYITGVIPHYLSQFTLDGIILKSSSLIPRDLKDQIISEIRKTNDKITICEEDN